MLYDVWMRVYYGNVINSTLYIMNTHSTTAYIQITIVESRLEHHITTITITNNNNRNLIKYNIEIRTHV